MKTLTEYLIEGLEDFVNEGEKSVLESKYVTFSEDELTDMSVDELWDAFEEAAAAKSACSIKKDKKGETEMASVIAEIRKLIKSKH